MALYENHVINKSALSVRKLLSFRTQCGNLRSFSTEIPHRLPRFARTKSSGMILNSLADRKAKGMDSRSNDNLRDFST